MNDRITDSRARLHAALVPLLDEGRVHKYVPPSVVSPCIWIDRHTWSTRSEGRAVVAVVTWSVMVLTDADNDEAQAFMDVLSARVHDAALRDGFRPTSARPQLVDVGGATTTALVVTVDDPLSVSTLCPPALPPLTPIAPMQPERQHT